MKRNTTGIKPHEFKPGESGNPNGRPPLLLSGVNAQLKQAGFEPVTNAQVLEAYSLLINLDEARIKEIIANTAYPMFLRIVGKAMLGQKGTDMIEKMLERAYGKAAQVLTGKDGQPIQFEHRQTIDLSKLSIDTLKELAGLTDHTAKTK